MRKASATRAPVAPQPEPDVVLTLSFETATILRSLIHNHVGGTPDGPRGDLSEIEKTLGGAGIPLTELQPDRKLTDARVLYLGPKPEPASTFRPMGAPLGLGAPYPSILEYERYMAGPICKQQAQSGYAPLRF